MNGPSPQESSAPSVQTIRHSLSGHQTPVEPQIEKEKEKKKVAVLTHFHHSPYRVLPTRYP